DKHLATEIKNLDTKRHKPVTFLELELALKEFILVYQDQTILSDAIIIEKAKLLAKGFKISEDQLKFSNRWLQKFKYRNRIHQIVLHEEAISANYAKIDEILPILKEKCNQYSLECWKEVTAKIIKNCWRKTVILPISADSIQSRNDPVCDKLIEVLNSLSFPNTIEVDEFLNIPDKNIIYEVSDNKVIEELVNIFNSEGTNESSEMDNSDELDNSIELPIISATAALENLKSIRLFLLQQDEVNKQLKLIDSLEKFIKIQF
ncbi:1700_t:CDS:2, partial [Dentiscutata heterogama]